MTPSLEQILTWSRNMLGGKAESNDYAIIKEAGEQPTRHYHTLAHFEALAHAASDNPPLPSLENAINNATLFDIVKAVSIRAGAHHDLVYLNADKHKLSPQLDTSLDVFVTRHPDGTVKTTVDMLPEQASQQQQQVFAWAQAIFHKKSDAPLGTNEYLSAVHAGLQGLEDGIAPKFILAEMMMIAGTIPFQKADYFKTLQSRLTDANAALSTQEQLTPSEMKGMMQGAVNLANMDVISFGLHDNVRFRLESIQLLHEAGHGEIGDTQRHNMSQFMTILKNQLISDQPDAMRIFHATHGFPNAETLSRLHQNAHEQIQHAIEYAIAC
jgi:hypothetical protein